MTKESDIHPGWFDLMQEMLLELRTIHAPGAIKPTEGPAEIRRLHAEIERLRSELEPLRASCIDIFKGFSADEILREPKSVRVAWGCGEQYVEVHAVEPSCSEMGNPITEQDQ